MPDGFVGNPALTYLSEVAGSLEEAAAAHCVDPFQNLSNRTAPPPALAARTNVQPPYDGGAARIGSHDTGVGNSTNIVADSGEYETIISDILVADGAVGECLHKVLEGIERICETSYVLPKATPKCLVVASAVKESLTMYGELAGGLATSINSFATEITGI